MSSAPVHLKRAASTGASAVELNIRNQISLAALYYGILCLLLVVIWQGLRALVARRHSHASVVVRFPQEEKGSFQSRSALSRGAALFNAAHSASSKTVFRTLPFASSDIDVAVVSFVGILVLFNVLALSVGTGSYHDDGQLKWIGKRSGRLTLPNLLFIFLTSSRNNLLSCVTGLPYKRFNAVHRLLGYWLLMLVIMHASIYSAAWVKTSTWISQLHDDDGALQYGLAAASSLLVLSVLPTIRFLRTRRYETFLLLHVLGAATLLATVFRHRPTTPYTPWIYACSALWAFDRTCRLLRGVWLHARSGHGRLIFDISVVADAVVLRAAVPAHFNWQAGDHVYATFLDSPFLSTPWMLMQSHPFSIVSSGCRSGNELVLVAKVAGSWTRKLAGAGSTVKAFVEGPYRGERARLASQMLFVAGGSGITHCLSLFDNAIARVAAGHGGAVTSIKLVWAVQSIDNVNWVAKELVAALDRAQLLIVEVTVDIFVTQRSVDQEKLDPPTQLTPFESSASGASTPTSKTLPARPTLSVQHGRPHLDLCMRDLAEQSGMSAVTVCGPRGMVRQCQSAARLVSAGPAAAFNGAGVIDLTVASF